ncbi:MAG: hypothetical protein J7L89_09915 [Bacteroidales bacterium]|nr:hypothetical protein [Bacteroidales bacterium]
MSYPAAETEFRQLSGLCREYHITTLDPQIRVIENLLKEPGPVNVAVIGPLFKHRICSP